MMSSTPESIAEAKRVLSHYLVRERDMPQSHRNRPRATFQTEGDSDTGFNNGDNLGRLPDARESARRYIESKLKNTRPDRQVDESNPAAVSGYIQALSWLQRKGKSRLKP